MALLQSNALTDEERVAVLGRNASDLFPRLRPTLARLFRHEPVHQPDGI